MWSGTWSQPRNGTSPNVCRTAIGSRPSKVAVIRATPGSGFLHAPLHVDVSAMSAREHYRLDKRPHFALLETPYGLRIGARRVADADRFYWSITYFMMPFYNAFNSGSATTRNRAWAASPGCRWTTPRPWRGASRGIRNVRGMTTSRATIRASERRASGTVLTASVHVRPWWVVAAHRAPRERLLARSRRTAQAAGAATRRSQVSERQIARIADADAANQRTSCLSAEGTQTPSDTALAGAENG